MSEIEECTKYIICDRCNIKVKSRCSMGLPEAVRLRAEIKKLEAGHRIIFNTVCSDLTNEQKAVVEQWEEKIAELLTYLPMKKRKDGYQE